MITESGLPNLKMSIFWKDDFISKIKNNFFGQIKNPISRGRQVQFEKRPTTVSAI